MRPAFSIKLLNLLAWATRQFHPRGTERMLRLIHHPDRAKEQGLKRILRYDRNLKISIDTSDFIEWSIFFYGYYEPKVAAWIKAQLAPGRIAIDIGANIGCHTLVMANQVGPTGKVLAVEPHPTSFVRLKENLRLNKLDQVIPIQMALSDQPGPGHLFSPKEGIASRGVSSFYQDNIKGTPEKISIQSTTLDRIVQEQNLTHLDLIKIDTEGNELKVFQGARQTLERFNPLILFEYSPRTWTNSRTSLSEAREILTDLGYRLERLDKKTISPDQSADLIAVPKPHNRKKKI